MSIIKLAGIDFLLDRHQKRKVNSFFRWNGIDNLRSIDSYAEGMRSRRSTVSYQSYPSHIRFLDDRKSIILTMGGKVGDTISGQEVKYEISWKFSSLGFFAEEGRHGRQWTEVTEQYETYNVPNRYLTKIREKNRSQKGKNGIAINHLDGIDGTQWLTFQRIIPNLLSITDLNTRQYLVGLRLAQNGVDEKPDASVRRVELSNRQKRRLSIGVDKLPGPK